MRHIRVKSLTSVIALGLLSLAFGLFAWLAWGLQSAEAIPRFPAPLMLRTNVTTAGDSVSGTHASPSISADGRYVAFESTARTLDGADSDGCADVFVRDNVAGATRRVSVAPDGRGANGFSKAPRISADGRYVVFVSSATDLTTTATGAVWNVFVRDLLNEVTSLVSMSTDRQPANSTCEGASISSDGRYVVFVSIASNLVPVDTNQMSDVFVRDLELGTTTRVSSDASGGPANGKSGDAAISGGGRFVVFASDASNLVPSDTNSAGDLFLKDLVTGAAERVNIDYRGEIHGEGYTPSVSDDGRMVAFEAGSAMTALDANGRPDVYVRDRYAGTTICASAGPDGRATSGSAPSLSGDGRFVAFSSNRNSDWYSIYVRELTSGIEVLGSANDAGVRDNQRCWAPQLSRDGRYVTFVSYASNLVLGDSNLAEDVFRRTLDTDAPDTTVLGPTDRWVSAPATLSLEVTDDLDPTPATYYRVGEGPVTQFVSSFAIATEGPSSVEYWSVDSCGRTEIHKTAPVLVDLTKPKTSVTGVPSGWVNTDVRLSLTALDTYDPSPTINYRLDAGPTTTFSGPLTFSDDAEYVVTFWAADRAGNVETPETCTVRVDKTAPETSATVAPSYDGSTVIQLRASDLGSGVAFTEHSLDGGLTWVRGTEALLAGHGPKVLQFRSTDLAGNQEKTRWASSVVRGESILTLSGPSTTPGPGEPATLCVALSDGTQAIAGPVIWIEASLDGVSWQRVRSALSSVQPIGIVVNPTVTTWFRARFDGDSNWISAASAPMCLQVTPAIPQEQQTAVSIKTSTTTTYIGKTPILTGTVTPTSMVGVNMVVYVKKPGKAYWTYSSNRTIYALNGGAAWQYKYYFKKGMTKGIYYFKAVTPAPGFANGAGFARSESGVVSVRLK